MSTVVLPSEAYECSLDHCPSSLYMPLSSRDVKAFTNFGPVHLGYQFQDYIDPTHLCQSLIKILEEFPAFSGHLVTINGAYHVKTWSNAPTVTSVEVSQAAIKDPAAWDETLKGFPMRLNNIAGKRLISLLLLHTKWQSDGCVLLVSFDHAQGPPCRHVTVLPRALVDAATCAMFMERWNDRHTAAFGVHRAPNAPRMALPEDSGHLKGDLTVRRFHFHTSRFEGLKAAINKDLPSADPANQVTTNDLILAMCACAVAARATQRGPLARIAMMADPRGRGQPVDFAGNAAEPISFYVPWTVLMSHDLGAVSRAVRHGVAAGVETLRTACHLEPSLGSYEHPLLQWNSWARAKGMVAANFGHTLQRFEWVNLRRLEESHIFIVVPVTADGGLALQVALPHNDMAYFRQIWDRFNSAPTNN